jgi:pilus assembly protein CpaF
MAREAIYTTTIRHFLAPLVPLLDDPTITEIMVVGAQRIYIEQEGKLRQHTGGFADEASLMAAVCNIAEWVDRPIGGTCHSLDGRLPTGERVHAIIPPASRSGICLTIRKFQSKYFQLDHLVTSQSLSALAADFLRVVVALHKNIVVSGGTGTGKTTLLSALSSAIAPDERIVVIEDSSELRLQQEHTVYLEAQTSIGADGQSVGIRELFVDSLRMRPDRIIVGEVRRGEALDLVQAMISGHPGAITSIHASSPALAAARLETLCLQSDTKLPLLVARSQVASAVHLVIQLSRLTDGTRRVTEIAECTGLDDHERYAWNSLFRFQVSGRDSRGHITGSLEHTGRLPTFTTEPECVGLYELTRGCRHLFPAAASPA